VRQIDTVKCQPMLTVSGQLRTSAADLTACRTLLRNGSRTFYAASYLLPRSVRDPATALYAFCRLADDAVDLEVETEKQLENLHQRLDAAYEGRPHDFAADRAFAETVHQFAIPKALPEALLEGFAWDAQSRHYMTLSDLHGYAARVAGTVGAMMSLLMGARSADLVARATDLGTAMQLTNIARDVGEDARAGRLYLPHEWLWEAGIDPHDWMKAPKFDMALGAVVQKLLDAAEILYQRAEVGIAGLPASCRPGIMAARLLYCEIGREVERRGLNSVDQRAVVARGRKIELLVRAIGPQWKLPFADEAGPLAASQFLVDAVVAQPAEILIVPASDTIPWWNLRGRWIRVLDLFEELEQRDRMIQSAGNYPIHQTPVTIQAGE
jgi:15-cis-phytoene synthase